ncbi:MAG: GNAT family N-acetyltransferase [Actinobacteria bacterium]|nr:GNAT family N-acetyltransferase [Actinomycetota bacterium]
MGKSNVIDWGADRLRVSPWRGDSSIAYLAPFPGRSPQPQTLDRCLDELRERGFRSVLTAALGRDEQGAFFAAGFQVHEELHLLRHDLRTIPYPPPVSLRRGRRRDERTVLKVDELAFDSFWRFDAPGLADARAATPTSRFRVAEHGGRVVGYAVTGRAAAVGYLQRLAVHPTLQGRGIGAALVIDTLRWSQRRNVAAVMVNTQAGNHRALALYERLGFRRESHGLAVLERVLAWE